MKRYLKKIMVVMVMVILCVVNLSVSTLAAPSLDTTKTCSLKVDTEHADIAFSLYHVAYFYGDVYAMDEDFASYSVDFTQTDAADVRATANALKAYVIRDQIVPVKTAYTDANNVALFADLKPGVYLVVAENFTHGGLNHSYAPVLVTLPGLDSNGDWDYNTLIYPKSESWTSYTDCIAIKTWNDKGFEQYRPEEIVVQLLRNGEIYEEVVLHADNNWRHTFRDLDKEDVWIVIEKEVPDGYTLGLSQAGNAFVLTNTFDEEEEPDIPDVPDIPDKPGTSVEPETSDKPDIPDEPDTPGKPEDKLPQTGQLWWPIPIFVIGGLLLLIIGRLLVRVK